MVVPLDIRLVKLLVFLFEVEQMYDPPQYALYEETVEAAPRNVHWLADTGPAVVVWGHGLDSLY